MIDHPSIVKDARHVSAEECSDAKCLCKGLGWHCPVCPVSVYWTVEKDEFQQHWTLKHGKSMVKYNDYHYHCPRCGTKVNRKSKMAQHIQLGNCKSPLPPEASPDPKLEGNDIPIQIKVSQRMTATAALKKRRKGCIGKADNFTAYKPTIDVGAWSHVSMVHHLDDLRLDQCRKCSLYHCPLCPSSGFLPSHLNKVRLHIKLSHHKRSVEHKGITLLKCCQPQCLPRRSKKTHWHCPLCPRKVCGRGFMENHLLSHLQGKAPSADKVMDRLLRMEEEAEAEDGEEDEEVDEDVEEAEDREGGEALATVDNDVSMEVSHLPGLDENQEDVGVDVFHQVIVIVSNSTLESLPGDTLTHLDSIQQEAAVQYKILGDDGSSDCLLQGSWANVEKARKILQALTGTGEAKNKKKSSKTTGGAKAKKLTKNRKQSSGKVSQTHENAEIDEAHDGDSSYGESPKGSMKIENSPQSVRRSRRQPKRSQLFKDFECDVSVTPDIPATPSVTTPSNTSNRTSEVPKSQNVGTKRCREQASTVESSQVSTEGEKHPKPEQADQASVEEGRVTEQTPPTKGNEEGVHRSQDNIQVEGDAAANGTEGDDDLSPPRKVKVTRKCDTTSELGADSLGFAQPGEEEEQKASEDTPLADSTAENDNQANPAPSSELASSEVISAPPDEGDCISCPWCDEQLMGVMSFIRHLLRELCPTLKQDAAGYDTVKGTSVEGLVQVVQDAEASVTQSHCPLCAKKFKSVVATRMHYAQRNCKDQAVQYEKEADTGKYKCRFCDFKDIVRSKMNLHMGRCHSEKTINCTICNKKFGSFFLLNVHHKSTHMFVKQWTMCSLCGVSVCSKNLKQHLDKVHGSEEDKAKWKPKLLAEAQQCLKCKYKTRNPTLFQNHVKRQHGEKNVKCPDCSASFAFAYDQKLHWEKVHSGQKADPIYDQCPHCQKSMLKKNIKTHIQRVHENFKPFQCPHCTKCCQTQFSLDCHINTHLPTSMKKHKFLCSYCGKGFMQKVTYKDHLNIHTGERPYRCQVCLKGFKQSAVYLKHKETHLPNKASRNNNVSVVRLPEARDQLAATETSQVMVSASCDCGQPFGNHTNTCMLLRAAAQLMAEKEVSSDMATTIYVVPSAGGEHGSEINMEAIVTEFSTDVMHAEGTGMEEATTEVAQDEGKDRYLCGHCQQLFISLEEVHTHMLVDHVTEAGVEEVVPTDGSVLVDNIHVVEDSLQVELDE